MDKLENLLIDADLKKHQPIVEALISAPFRESFSIPRVYTILGTSKHNYPSSDHFFFSKDLLKLKVNVIRFIAKTEELLGHYLEKR